MQKVKCYLGTKMFSLKFHDTPVDILLTFTRVRPFQALYKFSCPVFQGAFSILFPYIIYDITNLEVPCNLLKSYVKV